MSPSGNHWRQAVSGRGARSNDPRHSERSTLQLVREGEPAVSWPDYQRIAPGEYRAYCKRAKWYWERGFNRWTCLLHFDVFTEDLQVCFGKIPMWLNGGAGDKPKAGMRTRYLLEWVRANGGPPPRKDRMAPQVFVRRMARVRVADTRGPIPYSVVQEIVEWSTGQAVNQSHSQGEHLRSDAKSGS
jgi:hypothetical protein